ncbi:hypothetical protein K1719_017598 [Acacia pycnantha]|nr:hypothetical protein K1719_017598 [Acacia pycnantha]
MREGKEGNAKKEDNIMMITMGEEDLGGNYVEDNQGLNHVEGSSPIDLDLPADPGDTSSILEGNGLLHPGPSMDSSMVCESIDLFQVKCLCARVSLAHRDLELPLTQLLVFMDYIFYWNSRGACGKGLLRNLKLLCKGPKPIILFDAQRNRNCLDEHEGFVDILEEDKQFFHLRCRIPRLPTFLLTALYAIPHSDCRSLLWGNILRLSKGIQYPWSILGDFNDIASINERIGGKRIKDMCGHQLSVEENNSKVSDWCSGGVWNFSRLESLVPREVIQRLLAVLPPMPEAGNDVMLWNGATNGSFSQ